MKTLVVYYSNTGSNKYIAEKIALTRSWGKAFLPKLAQRRHGRAGRHSCAHFNSRRAAP